MLLIRGGRVIDPVREVDEIMDVMIEGSQIVETGKALKVPADAEVIDATGLVVAPGLMAMCIFAIQALLIRKILRLVRQQQPVADLPP